jgi:transposase-like protein
MEIKNNGNLEKSETVARMPLVCSDEAAAVEFFEAQLWGNKPKCAHCKSTNVYKMIDAKTGLRNKRFLLRCHDCKKQFTVRIGTVLKESRIPLRHWAYAFWRASTSKKGVSTLEIKRQCQISYKSALFLMHRIRFALTPGYGESPKLDGVVECDETYVGGKPRPASLPKGAKIISAPRGRSTITKTPVFGMVERGGRIQREVVTNVSAENFKAAIRENVSDSATIMTDDFPSYRGIGKDFDGGHHVVKHSHHQYANGIVHTNTAESSFAILKRGIVGIFHTVSKKHLHRYVNEFDFRWNARFENDGNRPVLAVKGASGKRLDYKTLTR